MTKCRWCNAEILWAVTEKGHRIPLDPSPSDRGNVALEFHPRGTPTATILGDLAKATGPLWIAHFATCPKVKRGKTKPNPQPLQTTLKL